MAELLQDDEATAELTNVVGVLTRALATDSAGVLVLARRAENCVLVQVSADDVQYGRLVGVNGQTARSLRRIVSSIAGKYKVTCDLSIGRFAAGERS